MVAVDNFLLLHSRKSVSSLELGVELAVEEAKAAMLTKSIHVKGVNSTGREADTTTWLTLVRTKMSHQKCRPNAHALGHLDDLIGFCPRPLFAAPVSVEMSIVLSMS